MIKMIKNAQTIRRQIADELFKSVWPFCGAGDLMVKNIFWEQSSWSWSNIPGYFFLILVC